MPLMDLMAEQRRARRAHILDTARALIAERGYAAVTMRDLAARCRVSVPTLYNQFGGKDELLGAAIEAHFIEVLTDPAAPDPDVSAPSASHSKASHSKASTSVASNPDAPGSGVPAPAGLPRLLQLVDRCAAQILDLADYHQRLLEAFSSMDSTAAVQHRLAERLALAMRAELECMQRRRQLAPWVDSGLLAGQMTSACIGTAVVWSSGLLPTEHLVHGMRYATGLVLLGVVRAGSRRKIEPAVEAAQAVLLDSAAALAVARQAGVGR